MKKKIKSLIPILFIAARCLTIYCSTVPNRPVLRLSLQKPV